MGFRPTRTGSRAATPSRCASVLPDWPLLIVRFGLYGTQGLLFGAPLFGLYALERPERNSIPLYAWLIPLAVLAAVLNVLGFALMLASMSGQPLVAVDPELARSILSEAPVGWAFAVRMACTAGAFAILLIVPVSQTAGMAGLGTLGAVALGSLAWNGHGAATDGALAWPHLLADIAHLLAAGAWLGAIACLLALAARARPGTANVGVALRCLAGFAGIGSLIVALLLLTGLVNSAVLLADQPIDWPPTSPYSRLLLAKLALFGIMLGLAALHRFQFVPDIERAADGAKAAAALKRLRLSMVIELGVGALILALVAWLGTVEPSW